MKSIPYFLSVVLVLLFTGFTTQPSSSDVMLLGSTNGFYYPASALKTMLNQGNGVRLYNASFPTNGGITLMAVAVTGEGDTRNVNYYVFKGASSGQGEIVSIDRETAIQGCQNLGNAQRFAVTIGEYEVNQLLSQSRATGILFEYATNGMGYQSLKVSPAAVSGRSIEVVNPSASYVVEHPCPLSCGSDAQTNYLCNMQ